VMMTPGKERGDKVRGCLPLKATPSNHTVHVTAARLRFGMSVKGYGWAARGDWER
jgi:hypothetical protein